jgi:hypothetical protein
MPDYNVASDLIMITQLNGGYDITAIFITRTDYYNTGLKHLTLL